MDEERRVVRRSGGFGNFVFGLGFLGKVLNCFVHF